MRRLTLLGLCLAASLPLEAPAAPPAQARTATPASAADAGLVARVDRRLQHPAVLRGRFEQEKRLAGFAKPVTSRGTFTVVRDKGVIWTTEAPYAGRLILTRDALVQRQGGGTQKLDAAREPALKAINTALFALLSGDLPALERYFSVTGRIDAKDWRLALTPRDAGWSRMLTAIELQGAAQIRQLDLLDANGDRTRIRFLDGRPDVAPSADEAAELD